MPVVDVNNAIIPRTENIILSPPVTNKEIRTKITILLAVNR